SRSFYNKPLKRFTMKKNKGSLSHIGILLGIIFLWSCTNGSKDTTDFTTFPIRERISINKVWHFMKYSPTAKEDDFIYDIRPEVKDKNDNRPADARPTKAVAITLDKKVLKPWILPNGNDFIKDTTKHYKRPPGNPGEDFPIVKADFDDSKWKVVDLPHDWAIKGPFLEGWNSKVGGGMGRLPSPGVAWYRKNILIPEADRNKSIFLDIDGAMSYAMVWING